MPVEQYEIPPDEWKRSKPDILVYHPKSPGHADGRFILRITTTPVRPTAARIRAMPGTIAGLPSSS